MKRGVKQRRPQKKTQVATAQKQSKRGNKALYLTLCFAGAILLAGMLGNFFLSGKTSKRAEPLTAPAETIPKAEVKVIAHPPQSLTFCKDIAPIIFENCANCHRPGQVGPFALLTYDAVKKRAKDIARVTQSRLMPPWPPEPGYNHFVGERILQAQQIADIQQWVAEGATEGNPSDLPALPKFPEGWTLGYPDLVVTMPQAYTLPAEGRDVYRNFVISLPLDRPQYIRAVDLSPGSKAVHHAFVLFDRTSQSRRLDAETPEPGFGGMGQPGNAQSPGDTFLSWQPGRIARDTGGGSWKLEPGTDLVLQMHMQTTGKPEAVQPSVAFYFTDKPSTNLMFKIGLDSFAIDIPPGATNYLVEDSYTIPIDLELTAIYPHAHYLGKELTGFAQLPDGTRKWLIMIKDWDFNWQGDYRYVEPLFLPKGSSVHMHFTYDNSTNNIRNPNNPPRRVTYGIQTTDEMANLAFLFKVRNERDLDILSRDYQYKAVKSIIAYNQHVLRLDPNDAHAHAQLGKAFLGLGKTADAESQLKQAISIKPNSYDAHYHLGLLYDDQNKLLLARPEYEKAVQYNPESVEARNNLGLLCLKQGDIPHAEEQFKVAYRLAPNDSVIQENLQLLKEEKQKRRTPR
jgi:Flp pilus assembly protein TadD/mono/diheme cytochrome c family protein